jgi:hypothetical protein
VSTATNSSAPATTTTVAAPSNITVFVNGQQIDTSGSTSTTVIGSNDLARLDALFTAMNAWLAGYSSGSGKGTTQVQIWNA